MKRIYKIELLIFSVISSISYSQDSLPKNLAYFYQDSHSINFYIPEQINKNGNYISFIIYTQIFDSLKKLNNRIYNGTVTLDCKRKIIKMKSLGYYEDGIYNNLIISPYSHPPITPYILIEPDLRNVDDRLYAKYIFYKFCECEKLDEIYLNLPVGK